MARLSYSVLVVELDKLFFLPFAANETPEMRMDSIEATLLAYGWTWDQMIEELSKPEGN